MKQASFHAFLPPGESIETGLDRLRLVRDGFSIWPLLFGPFWFLYKRLWFGAFLATVLIGTAFFVRIYFNLVEPGASLVTFLPSLLFALEASVIEARKLRRKGWEEVGLAVARNAAEAEIKIIERLSANAQGDRPGPNHVPAASQSAYPGTAPVLGLFPESVAPR